MSGQVLEAAFEQPLTTRTATFNARFCSSTSSTTPATLSTRSRLRLRTISRRDRWRWKSSGSNQAAGGGRAFHRGKLPTRLSCRRPTCQKFTTGRSLFRLSALPAEVCHLAAAGNPRCSCHQRWSHSRHHCAWHSLRVGRSTQAEIPARSQLPPRCRLAEFPQSREQTTAAGVAADAAVNEAFRRRPPAGRRLRGKSSSSFDKRRGARS